MDFNSILSTVFLILLQLIPNSTLFGHRLPKTGLRGVGIAEIFQGKDGVTIHLIPNGQVSLALYSLDGDEVVPSKDYVSPSVIKPFFPVSKSGYYLLVAREGAMAESFMVYLRVQ